MISAFDLLIQADVDGNGTIDYIEFITATMHLNRMEREDRLYKAFEYFDKDRSGYIHFTCIIFANYLFGYLLSATLMILSRDLGISL